MAKRKRARPRSASVAEDRRQNLAAFALLKAARGYLEVLGWSAVVASGPSIEARGDLSRVFDLDIRLRFTGKRTGPNAQP